MMRTLLAVTFLALAGCASTVIEVDAYDQSCAADADCVAVTVGDTCAICACASAAVNVSESERLAEDRQWLQNFCSPFRPQADCAACLDVAAVCVDAKCTTTPRN